MSVYNFTLNPHIGGGDIRLFVPEPTPTHIIGFTIYSGVYYLNTHVYILTCKAGPVPGVQQHWSLVSGLTYVIFDHFNACL